MIRDLFPLVVLVGAAVTIWILRERHRRRHEVNPPAPSITMAEVWEMWRAGIAGHPDGEFAPADAAAPPGVCEALAAIARHVEASDYPRAAVREAILELAGMALYLDAIGALGENERAALLKGYSPGVDEQLRATARAYQVEWMVLRWYTRMKYDDAVPGDWLHHYLRVAGPYVREKVRLAREHLVEFNEGAARFVQIYDALLAQLRHDMAAAPPKKRFPPSDLPGGG